MEDRGRDWIVYVSWNTIKEWKRRSRVVASGERPTQSNPQESSAQSDDYPFQYASNQPRFLKMEKGDRLWLVTLPKFQGFCQPPSVMARLEIEAVYDREKSCPVKVSPHVEGFGQYLAVGKSGRLIDSYPPLYNIYDVLIHAHFVSREKDLNRYKAWLKEAEFGARGPYHRLAQHFRTLRLLTYASGKRLREKHRIAVAGRRVFLSYRWGDFANKKGWLQKLVNALEKAAILSWWDRQQMQGREEAWGKQSDLIRALLDDGVQQAVWFVALGTKRYGAPGSSGRSWTLEEWEAAGEQTANPQRRHQLRRLLIQFGKSETPAHLPGQADVTIPVATNSRAEQVAGVITTVLSTYED